MVNPSPCAHRICPCSILETSLLTFLLISEEDVIRTCANEVERVREVRRFRE